MQLTIQLLGAPYDMRVSAGIEVKEDPSPPEVPFDGQQDCIVQRGWQYVRIRRRYSWQPPHGEYLLMMLMEFSYLFCPAPTNDGIFHCCIYVFNIYTSPLPPEGLAMHWRPDISIVTVQ